jgi:hypothetical protein
MKTFHTSHQRFAITALALAVIGGALSIFVPTASAKNGRTRSPQLISMYARESSNSELVTEALAATPDAWQNIQYYNYEKRQDFTAVFARMVAKLDEEIRALNEKRATMKNDTREWDFAMKELNSARADIQSKLSDLSRVNTADGWPEARDKLGIAWERAQTAAKSVRNSTTS